ncbi:glycosyltransferase family 2 protein [Pedobacter heparinus]|uniref:Glycosyl transferase family 2 n=1 Tax=Pedobacter heparinus (strain ATCC 13125 / DSM 2366 / CIP 104194 / JCM 7457 / NBRC 12017 / NCIMB 9290 / NRRL B-14731 / HIM 762-3) TaxID=485917 RepID=C6XWT6_PEDHD|nr:glycosyltransferase family A protein [Pedobacter heparinus]ACU04230.1 glycosyl transferase family 2 [Pedobacter heparinus DSM 2366]
MINLKEEALVSVIIPCYNHGRYLSKAIESVLAQTYTHFEIIVVDDGSGDNTKETAQNYKEVKYIYQMNQGLSAARNTGIDESTGEYLVFLDADDWLLKDALMINLNFIQASPQLAFVSGGFSFFFNKDQKMWDETSKVESNHYCHLLQKNFIAMIATVMFRRWVFDSFRYDTTLKVCEDYDLYLKVARRHPVAHHTELIAVYFIHDSNVSKGSVKMLNTALQILDAQKSGLRNAEERHWFNLGQTFWRKWYCTLMRDEMIMALNDTMEANMVTLKTLRKHNKRLYFDLIFKTVLAFFKVGK